MPNELAKRTALPIIPSASQFFTPEARKTHLHEGEVLLPPNIFGVHADEVVGVHDGVDKAVEHDSQVHVAVVSRVHVQPIELRPSERQKIICDTACKRE